MKKTLAITVALTIASFSAFAQGTVQGTVSFAGVGHTIFNASTALGLNTYGASQGFDVAMLFSTTSGGATFAATQSTTNAALSTYQATDAWANIASAITSGFFYINGTNTVVPGIAVATITGTQGTFTYNGSGNTAFYPNTIANNIPSTYYAIEVAWYTGGGLYLTPSAAAAAGVQVGWSKEFVYNTQSGVTAPTTITAALLGVGGYGVGGMVPEPSTMALAGLGGLSLLLFRRRK